MNFLSKKNLPLSIWKSLILCGNSAVVIITCMMLFGVWRVGDRLFKTITSLFTFSEPQIEVPKNLINQIREASELTTTIFITQAVVPTRGDRKLGEIVIASTKLLYVAQGEVKAGIDLKEINENHISIKDNDIEIQLPPAKILDRKIDVNESHVYDYNRGFLGLGPDIAPELQTLAQRETLTQIVTTACNQGILEEANQKAVVTLTNFFRTTGVENIKIKPSPVTTCQ